MPMSRLVVMRPARRLIVAVLLLSSWLAGPLAPRHAFAAIQGCQSDPAVILSNLATLDLQAGIGDSLTDVKQVVYVVHAPVGIKMLALINTDGLMGLKEKVMFYSDNLPNTFDTQTIVYTGKPATVKAYSTDVSALNLILGTATAPGMSGQWLHLHFTTLL